MATTLNLATKPSRSDVFGINPFEIEVKDDQRGRHTPPTDDEILKKALGMLPPSMGGLGQLQAVEARRKDDKSLLLTLGFTRTAAARLIVTGFNHPVTGETIQIPDFRLQVKVVDCDDATAFKRNIAENNDRNATSPVDDAFNQKRLADECGMDDDAIAAFYHYGSDGGGKPNTVKVKNLRRLLDHTPEILAKVHAGEMGVDAALALFDLPENERAAAVQAATRTSTGTVNGAVIKAQVRAKVLSDSEKANETPAAPGTAQDGPKTKPLTMKEVKRFLTNAADPTKDADPAIRRFARDMSEWIAGKKGDTAMMNALNRLLDAQPTPAVEAA